MQRAISENDIPTLPAFAVPGPPATPRRPFVIDTAAEAFFAVGVAMNDVGSSEPSEEELLASLGLTPAQRRRAFARYVVAVVVVCLGILGASAGQLG